MFYKKDKESHNLDTVIFCRTPEKLHTWIKAVVNAYHFSREGTLVKEARDLMNPKIIQKLEEMEKLIRDKFM
ncbi:hypothetical protein HanLR1_Chr05g0194561 [Helianthus annuus]|nr:hypothetical protein HanLR1_Chr05g0194561 [Helianthus annuus]